MKGERQQYQTVRASGHSWLKLAHSFSSSLARRSSTFCRNGTLLNLNNSMFLVSRKLLPWSKEASAGWDRIDTGNFPNALAVCVAR